MMIMTAEPNGFFCNLNRITQLKCQCDLGGGTSDFTVSSAGITPYNWYILMIRAQAGSSQLQLREMSFDIVQQSQTKGLFFPGAQSSFSFQSVTIGLYSDQQSQGFIGNIRNFKVITGYLDDYTMRNIQYGYFVSAPSSFIIDILISNSNDIQNQVQGIGISQTIGQYNTDQALVTQTDFTGVFQCEEAQPSQAYIFDEVTCIDSKPKLYFPSTTSYISVALQTTNIVNNYTIEFWFRSLQQIITGEAYLLSLKQQSGDIMTVVKLERNSSLSCYTSYSGSPSQAISYFDFSGSSQTWIHVSCIQDETNGLQRGTLFEGSQDYSYSSSLSILSNYSASSNFNLYLNTNPATMSQGSSQIYYSEVKFWTFARNIQSIQDQRYQQQDPTLVASNMLSYLKLLSGSMDGNNLPTEIDFADQLLTRTIHVSSDLIWQTQSDIVFCPVGIFKSDVLLDGTNTEMVCYREGVNIFEVLIYKDPIRGYVITPAYSKYTNNYVRDSQTTLYNYQWTISSMFPSSQPAFFTSFSTQQNNQELQFQQSQISNMTGVYQLQLVMTDNRQWQNVQTQTVTLKTLSCAQIFDQQTNLSYVYIDLKTEKNQQDVVFTYGYTNCSGAYILDKSQMTFTIDNNGVTLSSADHNQKAQTYTLKTINQGSLPLNKYLYFKIGGVWKNPKNSGDTAQFTLIYACRFVSLLSVSLTPNLQILLLGQALVIDYSASFINMDTITPSMQYTVKWTCPGGLNSICATQGKELQINSNQVLNAGLNFWQPYTIIMTAYTNYVQGNGLMQSNASVTVEWLNVNSNAFLTVISSKNYSKNSNITIQLTVPGLTDSQMTIAWTILPNINNSQCFPNSNNRKEYVIVSTCLQEGVQYNVTTSILYLQYTQVIWSGFTLITIPKPPSGGTVSCSPNQARAYQDQITCTASNWKVTNGPARYQFYSSFHNGSLYALSPIIVYNNFTTVFPPSTSVFVKIIDQTGLFIFGNSSINVTIAQTFSLQGQVLQQLGLAQFTKYIQTTDLMQTFTLLASAIVNQQSNKTFVTQASDLLSGIISFQVQNFSTVFTLDQRHFVAQSILQVSTLITSIPTFSSLYSLTTIQNLLQQNLIPDTAVLNALQTEPQYSQMLLTMQSNIITLMKTFQSNGKFDITNNNSLSTNDSAVVKNLTQQVRQILVSYEQYLSISLPEGEYYTLQNSVFNYSVQKFAKPYSNSIVSSYSDASPLLNYSYAFPISTANQPTESQSLTVISFKTNPFIGSSYLNQTLKSTQAVYFAYRDNQGNYLSTTNVPGRINLTFPITYSPFVFLPNASVCGYIGVQDTQWENSSCITTFSRDRGVAYCSCQHMSFYSIIDDNLLRPDTIPLIQLTFQNWVSFIAILYVPMFFIIGVIYSYNMDNQDFRYLHEQEELQGNEMEYDEQVSLVSLAFKRKVFFMDFSDDYSYLKLFRIYLMLLHPVFQLKYRLDPHIPRFYRFLFLFTRINIAFGLTFFLLREIPNSTSSNDIAKLILFIVVGSLLFLPLPVFLYSPFRSRYLLLKPKSQSEYDKQSPDDIGGQQDEFEDRITNVEIDASIPIKLLFLINAISIDKIITDNGEKFGYCSGDPSAVGSKLLELDEEWINRQQEKAKKEQVPQHSSAALVSKEPLATVEQKSDQNMIVQDEIDFNMRSSPLRRKQQPLGGEVFQVPDDVAQDENMGEGTDEENVGGRKISNDQKSSNKKNQFEGGEQETKATALTTRNLQALTMEQPRITNEQNDESDFSIDTNLFIDEKKEILEFSNYCLRIFGGFLSFIVNVGIYVAVLYVFITEGYYNVGNYYIWVLSFFGSQLFGLLITDTLCLLLLAATVSKWCRFRKSFLARFFTESLYIYEDYLFVVKFAKTKIS